MPPGLTSLSWKTDWLRSSSFTTCTCHLHPGSRLRESLFCTTDREMMLRSSNAGDPSSAANSTVDKQCKIGFTALIVTYLLADDMFVNSLSGDWALFRSTKCDVSRRPIAFFWFLSYCVEHGLLCATLNPIVLVNPTKIKKVEDVP